MQKTSVQPTGHRPTAVHHPRHRLGVLTLLLAGAWQMGCASAPAPAASAQANVTQARSAPAAGRTAAPTQQGMRAELLPNARTPRPGLLTGGAPDPEQLRELHRRGYRVVISLLAGADEEAQAASKLGMEFTSIPVAGPEDLTEDHARRLHETLQQHEHEPVVLHCASGNRAGALLALAAFYGEGQTPRAALDLGEAAGLTTLRSYVAAQLGITEPADP